MNAESSATVSAWADLGSMVLLGIAMLIGGLSASRPVWGRSRKHVIALVLSFLVAIAFSVFRFVTEGIFETSGPREFLAGTVVYISQWLWLYLRMSCPHLKEARLVKVARTLRNVKMLRIGRSTDEGIEGATKEPKYCEMDRNRHSQLEVVMRKGVREAPRGNRYWRGVKTKCKLIHGIWDVTIAQRNLHADLLDAIGTIGYISKDEATVDEAYRRFYRVVMTAVSVREPTEAELDEASGKRNPRSQHHPPSSLAKLVDAPSVCTSTSETRVTASSAGQTNGEELEDPPTQREDLEVPSRSPGNASGVPLGGAHGGPRPSREVDFSQFFNEWKGYNVEAVATRVGATDVRPIAKVARRIAADAIAFVNGEEEFRTAKQVAILNACLADGARKQFPSPPRPEHVTVRIAGQRNGAKS